MIDNAILALMMNKEQPKVEEKKSTPKSKTALNDKMDIRDMIAMVVGKRYTSLSDDDIRSTYNRMGQILGTEKAQKLLNHLFLFNQNPGGKSPEQALTELYTTGAKDSEVASLLKESSGLAYGPLEGFRTSSLFGNSEVQNKTFTKPGKDYGAGDAIKNSTAFKNISQ